MPISFDTTGVGALTLCFDLAYDRTWAFDGVLVYVSDETHSPEQVFCLMGDAHPDIDGTLYNFCVDLPSWAENNPAVAVKFVLHTNVSWRNYIFLDNISLKGWVSDAAGIVDVGAITETANGFYEFSVSNMTGGMMSPWIHCSWDSPASPVEASTTIHFTN